MLSATGSILGWEPMILHAVQHGRNDWILKNYKKRETYGRFYRQKRKWYDQRDRAWRSVARGCSQGLLQHQKRETVRHVLSPARSRSAALQTPCLCTSGLRLREYIFVVLSYKCVLSLLQHPKEVSKLRNPIYFSSSDSIYTFQPPILTVLRGHTQASNCCFTSALGYPIDISNLVWPTEFLISISCIHKSVSLSSLSINVTVISGLELRSNYFMAPAKNLSIMLDSFPWTPST